MDKLPLKKLAMSVKLRNCHKLINKPMSNCEPKVAAIFITYNQKEYVVDALRSIFDQSYQNFEIIISDDCSTDGTYEVLDSIVSNYQGPQKIFLNRSSKNIGIGANTQLAINLSDADFYITCDGDDISHKDRFEKIIEYFKSENCGSNLLASDAISIKKNGEISGVKVSDDLSKIKSLEDLFDQPPIFFGATTAFSKDLINNFPQISEGVSAVDQIMLLRAILKGSASTIHEPLVLHRQGGITGFKAKDVYQKISRLKRDSKRTTADISQMILDAASVGQDQIVFNRFKDYLITADYINKIFSANFFSEKIKLLYPSKHVPITRRIRFFSYATCTPFLNIFWSIKALFIKA